MSPGSGGRGPPPPPPRYAPGRPLPAYAFPGDGLGVPHPWRDADGHGYGAPELAAVPLDPDRWRACEPYLFGVDLFNRGYYWEAHEAWEAAWAASGKRTPAGLLLRGLIKLAAAGVKAYQGRTAGLRRHGTAAAEHFEDARRAAGRDRLAGLDLHALRAFGLELARREARPPRGEAGVPEPILGHVLEPR